MLISVKYLFDVYFYVNLKNAVSLARFRSGFFMLQFVTSNSSISENTICTWVFFYSRTYIYFQTNLNIQQSCELAFVSRLWNLTTGIQSLVI